MAPARSDLFGLRRRVVVVTGGTRGIGRALADRVARAGARVVVASRSGAACERLARTLTKRHGGPALGVECDLRDEESVRRLFQRIRAWNHGPVAGLANVAGYPVVPRLWNTPLHRLRPAEVAHDYEAVHGIDLRGSRLCTYWALRDMVKARRGAIVYFSSTPALAGYKGGPYTEAKAGILGLMRDVAREYGPYGIRANAIAPGNIRTDWLDEIPAKERRALEKENPLRRFGEPREAADAAFFLLSSLSSFVTAQTLVVDGGTLSR